MKVLINSIDYIYRNKIRGVLIECGVWKGGCIMAMMERLRQLKMRRQVWAYDTFSKGMTGSSSADIDCKGNSGSSLEGQLFTPREEFEANISKVDYDFKRIRIIEGDIRKTIISHTPQRISLLRIDIDFYEATKCVLKNCYPLVSEGGVVIFDDYSWWDGCKLAVDEYFDNMEESPTYVSADHHYLVK